MNLSSELEQMGHKIIIFTPKPAARKEVSNFVHPGIQIKYIPSIPAMVYPNLRLGVPVSPDAVKKIRALDIDVIHVHSALTVGLGGLLIGKILKIPVIGTQHTYAMEEDFLEVIQLHYVTKQISSFLWKYTEIMLNQCDHVIAPMEMIKKDLIRHGIKPPITILPNTIQPRSIEKVSLTALSQLRKKLGLSKQVVLFVGRLSKEKSIDTLLHSFKIVKKKKKHVSLLIIGDGPQAKPLLRLAKRLGIFENVVFTGELDQKTLLTKGYFQLADLFATASTTEVQPVSLIEAFYFGLPLAGVAKLGSLEMVKGIGLLSSPGSKVSLAKNMLSILNSKQLRKSLSEKSQEEYKTRYEPSKISQAYIDICQTLLNSIRETKF